MCRPACGSARLRDCACPVPMRNRLAYKLKRSFTDRASPEMATVFGKRDFSEPGRGNYLSCCPPDCSKCWRTEDGYGLALYLTSTAVNYLPVTSCPQVDRTAWPTRRGPPSLLILVLVDFARRLPEPSNNWRTIQLRIARVSDDDRWAACQLRRPKIGSTADSGWFDGACRPLLHGDA